MPTPSTIGNVIKNIENVGTFVLSKRPTIATELPIVKGIFGFTYHDATKGFITISPKHSKGVITTASDNWILVSVPK
jgi:hypothetical protein